MNLLLTLVTSTKECQGSALASKEEHGMKWHLEARPLRFYSTTPGTVWRMLATARAVFSC